MSLNLSIIIPIYNAEHMIEKTVERIDNLLKPLPISYELLLKDDGSEDNSGGVLDRISAKYSQLRCSSNDSNEGLGATLRKLFNEAKGDNIIYCDCDLPFGERIIPLLLGEIRENDIVVASRYSGIPNLVPLHRKIASRLYYYLCKTIYNIPVADIGSGSVAMRKESISKIQLRSAGFGIHAELLVKAARNGLKIKEIPAEHSGVNAGTFRIWKHGISTLIETAALW